VSVPPDGGDKRNAPPRANHDLLDSTQPYSDPPPLDLADSLEAEPIQLPATLNLRYELLAAVGSGASGTVYRARDRVADRIVALKILKRRSEKADLGRVRRELNAALQVTHPGVVRIHDLIEVEGRLALSMELIEGRTLEARLHHGPSLSASEIVALAIDLARALAAAHRAGVVHRDLKPANILLRAADQRPVITDFGIASSGEEPVALESDADASEAASPILTGEGVLVGTPLYMAPEQLCGRAAGPAADVYAFGLVLFEAATGARPHAARSLGQLSLLRLRTRPALVHTLRPDLPERLCAVIDRSLSLEPAERFATGVELRAALREATETTEPPQLSIAARPHHRVHSLAVLAGVLFTLGLASYLLRRPLLQLTGGRTAWRSQIRELGPAYEENSDWVDISPDSRSMAFISDRDGSWRIYVAPTLGDAAHPVTPPLPSAPSFPQWTRDGRALLFGAKLNGELIVQRLILADGRIEEVTRGAMEAQDCGDVLLLRAPTAPSCQYCARILTLRDGVTREIFREEQGSIMSSARCDRAGQRVVFGLSMPTAESRALHETLWIMNIDGSQRRRVVDDGGGFAYPSFHPDGRSVLYSTKREGATGIWEATLEGGAAERLTSGNFDQAPIVSPDGRVLIFDVDTSSLSMFAFSDGKQRRLTMRLDDQLFASVATHDGRALIMTSVNGAHISVVKLLLADGTQTVLAPGYLATLSPDDATVYVASDEDGDGVRAMPLAGGAAHTLARLPRPAVAMSFGGDGALHLALRTKQEPEAWRLELDGKLTREAPAPYRIVLPAPVGAWRVAGIDEGEHHQLELIAPGSVLGAPTNKRLPVLPWVWDANGRAVIGWNETDFVRVGLDGTVQRLAALGDGAYGVAISPDGKTLYGAQAVGHTRRELVANYGERPRPH
jgi:serine/threonine protein kinase